MWLSNFLIEIFIAIIIDSHAGVSNNTESALFLVFPNGNILQNYSVNHNQEGHWVEYNPPIYSPYPGSLTPSNHQFVLHL